MSASPAETSANTFLVTALSVSPFESDHHLLRAAFSQLHWKLFVACDYETALPLLLQKSISVVLCERQFPGGDWRLLLEACARVPAPPKLIVASRLSDEILWADVLQMGGYDVLSTPFDPREVFRSVSLAGHSWLSDRGARTVLGNQPFSSAAIAAG